MIKLQEFHYVFDIETIPLPKEQRMFSKPTEDSIKYGNLKDPIKRKDKYDEALVAWETGEDAALRPETGRVAMIGICTEDNPVEIIEGGETNDEISILCEFWDTLGEMTRDRDMVIGFNSNNFDVPFLIKRSLILGVEVFPCFRLDISHYHPSIFIDLMQMWAFGVKGEYISLKYLCGAMGIPVKEGPVEGKDFFKWWAGGNEKRELCREYCRQDVDATRNLAVRLGY